MARKEGEIKKAAAKRHIRKRVWFAAVVLIIALILLGLSWKSGLWGFQSAEEKLAAIEAERAIPDDENAAVIYSQLVDDYDEGSLWPDILNRETDRLTQSEPWLSKDYSELAAWIKERQGAISRLLEALKVEKCRFPIITDASAERDKMQLLRTMKQWARLLVRAGNNDMAEGRVGAALEKYLCLVQMGKHMRQQPEPVEYLVGVGIEALGLAAVARFTAEGNATETHLKMIEAAMPQTNDNWSKDSSMLRETGRLCSKIRYSPFKRLLDSWRYRDFKPFDIMHEIYLRSLVTRRGHRILIALRRHKIKTGKWPEDVDEIQSSLSEEILTDPFNSGSFVYKLSDDTFELYSKGKNNIDEDGKRDRRSVKETGADDWLIWPKTRSKSKEKNTDAKQD